MISIVVELKEIILVNSFSVFFLYLCCVSIKKFTLFDGVVSIVIDSIIDFILIIMISCLLLSM